VANVLAFTPVCLAILVPVYAGLIYLASGPLPLHAFGMFATLFLLLILFFVGSGLVLVRHLIVLFFSLQEG